MSKIERSVGKEPAYASGEQRYCLLAIGPNAEHRVWLVVDGDVLYVDCNGNGDLTQPGKRFSLPKFQREGKCPFLEWRELDTGPILAGPPRYTHLTIAQKRRRLDLQPTSKSEEDLRQRIQQEFQETHELISYCVEITISLGSGHSEAKADDAHLKLLTFADPAGALIFSKRPQDAPIIHFDGALSVQIQPNQHLRRGDMVQNLKAQLGSLNAYFIRASIGTRGVGPGTFAYVSPDDFPDGHHPKAEVRFQSATKGNPIVSSVDLSERWSGYEFVGAIEGVPEEAKGRTAKITISVPNWPYRTIKPFEGELPVLDAAPLVSFR
ncbi:MAG TPA: hypothetical protein VK395_25185 [Gemmataceae bacterium]|nr:hypothetical protein [Gemmataceae bacterium]